MSSAGLDDRTTEHHLVLEGIPESAGQARRELRRFLERVRRLEWADAAELAMSEIVTNAALHAHTDIDIRLAAMSDRLCVEVRDWNRALPEERSYGVDATTGRGMALVRTLALDCGVKRLADGKVVWFQIGDPPERSVDDLLAMWDLADADDEPVDPNALHVELLALPATLWLAARQHHDALLRELRLLYVGRTIPFNTAAADTAHGFISRAVAHGIDQAEAAGHARNPLPDGYPSALPWVPEDLDVFFDLADDPIIFEALQDVLDEGERLATERQLLMRPGLPEIIAVRDWACEQAISQAGGALAIPWAGTDHEYFETATSTLRPAHGWDTAAVSRSERGVVAADDTNRIVAISPSLAECLGWRPEDLVGRRVVTLIPPRLREAHVAGFTRHLATGVAHALGVPLTLPVLRKDSSEIDCHFLVEQATATGGRSGYLAWISPAETGPRPVAAVDGPPASRPGTAAGSHPKGRRHERPSVRDSVPTGHGRRGDVSENLDQRLNLRVLLDAVEAAPPVDAVDVFARELATMLDATSISLLITNFSGDAVVRMSHVTGTTATDGHNERAQSIALSGSPYEEVLHRQEPDVCRVTNGWDLLVPVTERGDAIGILELSLPHAPDKDVLDYVESTAHALAFVLIASRRHTDLFEWAQRDTPFSLAAEIQRRLLPSAYTIEGGPFTVAGWLEPAANVGGDTFDYSVDREYLYASLTDAMGHSTMAAMLATLTVGSLRNTRRAISSPAEQARAANRALLESSNAEQFVTGLLLRTRLSDGTTEMVNAGHPPPFLLRQGRAATVDLPPDPALGVVESQHRTHRIDLQPGDRLLLVTDGFLERNAVRVDIQSTLEQTIERHPREVVRELASNILAVTGGNLRDDATVLCIDWHGPGGQRDAVAGASHNRATT